MSGLGFDRDSDIEYHQLLINYKVILAALIDSEQMLLSIDVLQCSTIFVLKLYINLK